jgi:hypothetical protein
MSTSAAPFVLDWHHSKLREWTVVYGQYGLWGVFVSFFSLMWFCFCLCTVAVLLNFSALGVGV